jgi:hypothetical protein
MVLEWQKRDKKKQRRLSVRRLRLYGSRVLERMFSRALISLAPWQSNRPEAADGKSTWRTIPSETNLGGIIRPCILTE